MKGKTLDEVLTITNSDIAKHLSLPPVKLHCSMLAEDAVKVGVRSVVSNEASLGTNINDAAFLKIKCLPMSVT